VELKSIRDYNKNIKIVNDGVFENLTFDLNNILSKTLTYSSSPVFFKDCISHVNISAIITTSDIYNAYLNNFGVISKGVVISDNPRLDFFKFHNYLAEKTDFYKTYIGYAIGNNCTIAGYASIASNNIVIGNNVIIDDFVKIHENVTIGDNSIILAGSVIGGEGYQSLYEGSNLIKVKHVGGVRIGKNVEIKNNCCIVKHIFRDYTTIGDESILDNLVHFAHGAKCGKSCRITANAMIGGSVILGDDVWIGPSSTITSAIKIGNNVKVSLGSVVTQNVDDNEKVTGNFAIEHDKFINFIKTIR
jgi:acyl-[acyl carrier protein]--UDP-N-acetylglucosamine O-acyltransferase